MNEVNELGVSCSKEDNKTNSSGKENYFRHGGKRVVEFIIATEVRKHYKQRTNLGLKQEPEPEYDTEIDMICNNEGGKRKRHHVKI